MARGQDKGVGKNWFPTWMNSDSDIVRLAVCPEGMEKNLVVVERERIELVGELTDKHRVTDRTWRAMKSMNMA